MSIRTLLTVICLPMSSSSLAADCLKWDWYWSGNFESTDCSRWCFRSPAHLCLMLKWVFHKQDKVLTNEKRVYLLTNFCSCLDSRFHNSAVFWMWKTYFSICHNIYHEWTMNVSWKASYWLWSVSHITYALVQSC